VNIANRLAVARRAYEDRRFQCFNELPEARFEAFLLVPMVSGGRLVGLIRVQNRAPHLYSPDEISLSVLLGFMGGAEVDERVWRARIRRC